MNNNVLITSAGQRVSLVRAFQKELKSLDKESKVFTVDLNPVLAPACHVSDGYKSISRVDAEDYIEELISVCKSLNIKIVIPTIDTELLILAKNREKLYDEGIKPIVSSSEFVEKCRDKRLINQFFSENGIEIPVQFTKTEFSFPLFIKPYDGSLSKDIFIINQKSELTDYHLNNPKLMFMEYLDQKDHVEYTVDAYYNQKGYLMCAVPRKRIFIRAGEINKGVTNKNQVLIYVKEKLAYIKGARGCLTMQFFLNQSTGKIYGIEINPRFGGGYPLSYLSGANYPKLIIEEYLFNKKIDYFEDWEDNLLMLRYDDEILVHNYEG